MTNKARLEQGQAEQLDQYYTSPEYALNFYATVNNVIDLSKADIILEPSAGTGNFLTLFDPSKRIGLDLDPKFPGIMQQDFLKWDPPLGKHIATIGNPPFGKNANLAVKFFNHSAKFSQSISFIVPRTFRKSSIINRLDPSFHLIHDETVPDYSFLFNNKPYNVWCCAQVWIKKTVPREKNKIFKFNDVKKWFEVVDPECADFSVQRVGGRAGLIRTEDFRKYSRQSHYFIKQHNPRVIEIFKQINFDCVKDNTAGNPSVSPSELIELWLSKAVELNLIDVNNPFPFKIE